MGQQALELQLERFFTVWAWKWDVEDDDSDADVAALVEGHGGRRGADEQLEQAC